MECLQTISMETREFNEDQTPIISEFLEFGNHPGAVLVSDSATRLVYANQVACKCLGYNYNELVDLSMTDVAPEIGSHILAKLSLTPESEQNVAISTCFLRKNNSSLSMNIRIIPSESAPYYYVIVADAEC